MAKIFSTDEEIVQLVQDEFEETGLPQLGVNIKVMSVTKANEITKVSRASATTQHLTHTSDLVTLFIYEEAFDRLTDEYKKLLIKGALSNVSYDTEKDKLNVDTTRYGEFVRMRRTNPEYADAIETGFLVIEQIADEEKERKESEKKQKRR